MGVAIGSAPEHRVLKTFICIPAYTGKPIMQVSRHITVIHREELHILQKQDIQGVVSPYVRKQPVRNNLLVIITIGMEIVRLHQAVVEETLILTGIPVMCQVRMAETIEWAKKLLWWWLFSIQTLGKCWNLLLWHRRPMVWLSWSGNLCEKSKTMAFK